jgi:glycosyltransferase involved in cell wall biosynthesis
MNILFLTREYKHENLPPCGGTGNFIAAVAKELAKRNHNIYVFGIYKSNIYFEDYGVKVTFGKSLFLKNPLLNLVRSISKKISFLEKLHFYVHELEKKNIAKQLYAFIEKNNLVIDIIEIHDFEGISLYLNDSIPYIIRCHGSYSVLGKFFGYKVEKGRLHCEREAFKKAKNIISISKYSAKINIELFSIKNFKLIYNGIDTELFKPKPNSAVIPKSIFYFGNTSKEKGADIALKAFIILLKTKPEATLHFLGNETSYKNELLKLINENGIANKVFFYGMQSSKKVIEILSKAHVVIFPSRGETFGLALCEAMALEKPIIVSNIDSFQEIIEHEQNGFIANKIQDYVTYISYFFENEKESNTIGIKARETIIEKFNQDKMLEKSIDYYKEVIEDFKNLK